MIIISKFSGRCRDCGLPHEAGDYVSWMRGIKGVLCLGCGGDDLPRRLDERPDAQQGPFLKALAALEEALLTRAEKSQTPHFEKT